LDARGKVLLVVVKDMEGHTSLSQEVEMSYLTEPAHARQAKETFDATQGSCAEKH